MPEFTNSTATRAFLTVDVEDYFQVEAFSDRVSRQEWDGYPSRVVANTKTLLDLFDECHVKATFFILGWVAEHHPQLVGEIVKRGHEPACHSYWHRPVFQLSREEFREDTQRAKHSIENAAGAAVHGYRAPSFSIIRESYWALDVLAECGFRYDSSIFPISHDFYGIPDAPRAPYLVQTPNGALVEFPMTTFRLLRQTNLPVGGGGYLRILPFWFTSLGIRRARAEGLPLITYIHPWEVDPGQPRLDGRLTSRLRHYTNLRQTAARLRALIAQIQFSNFRDSGLVDTMLASEPHSLSRITA